MEAEPESQVLQVMLPTIWSTGHSCTLESFKRKNLRLCHLCLRPRVAYLPQPWIQHVMMLTMMMVKMVLCPRVGDPNSYTPTCHPRTTGVGGKGVLQPDVSWGRRSSWLVSQMLLSQCPHALIASFPSTECLDVTHICRESVWHKNSKKINSTAGGRVGRAPETKRCLGRFRWGDYLQERGKTRQCT